MLHMPGAIDLDALWREHRRFVAAVLIAHRPLGAAVPELEDLLQDVAMKVVAHANELRDRSRARAWLRSIAVNVATSAGRKSAVRRRTFANDAPDEHGIVDPRIAQEAHSSDARDSAGQVLALARALPVEYREPLLLKSLEGMSQRAIADALELPETTIETRLTRARAMLRAEIEKAEIVIPVRLAERSRP